MASVVTKVAAELPALRAVATTDASKAREIINRLKVCRTQGGSLVMIDSIPRYTYTMRAFTGFDDRVS
jgi:hypothetical protein